MKGHDEIRRLLSAAAGGDLSADDRMSVERHLQECPECNAEYSELKAVLAALKAAPELEPPPWLAARIMARIKDEPYPRRSMFARLFLPLHLKLPLEAFALVMICVTAWYVMQDVEKNTQMKEVSPGRISASKDDAAQPLKTPDTKQAENSDKQKNVAVPPPQPQMPSAPLTALPQPPAAADRPVSEGTTRQQPLQSAPMFAPQPPGRVTPAIESAEKARPTSEPPSAPLMQRREEAAGAAAVPAAEKKKAAIPKSEAADRALSAASLQMLNIRLMVDDRDSFPERLRNLVSTAGGAVISADQESVRCRMDASKLPQFLSGLSRMAKFATRQPESIPKSGVVMINIAW